MEMRDREGDIPVHESEQKQAVSRVARDTRNLV
jgi:hypothetical protein